MGHHDLRHDKECQNCGHTVEVAYCSKCGQHNIETRQPFHHLITHTIEDITHYDSNFWKTIKYLLFRPGKLTIEYLSGHRMRHVAPVKLYIFISFVCFFIMALMAPSDEEVHEANHKAEHTAEPATTAPIVKTTDTITISPSNLFKKESKEQELVQKESTEKKDTIVHNNAVIHNVRELDSLQKIWPEDKKMSLLDYYGNKVVLKMNEKDLSTRDFIIALSHTVPKVLFIYMPIFAFWLWLFHGKRRWYFFDHGIFTLHYFSFLLLLTTINMILSWLSRISDNDIYSLIFNIITPIVGIATCIYPFFYFFRAHSKFYGERKAISRLKSFTLFIINFFLIIALVLLTLAYIVLNSH